MQFAGNGGLTVNVHFAGAVDFGEAVSDTEVV